MERFKALATKIARALIGFVCISLLAKVFLKTSHSRAVKFSKGGVTHLAACLPSPIWREEKGLSQEVYC